MGPGRKEHVKWMKVLDEHGETERLDCRQEDDTRVGCLVVAKREAEETPSIWITCWDEEGNETALAPLPLAVFEELMRRVE